MASDLPLDGPSRRTDRVSVGAAGHRILTDVEALQRGIDRSLDAVERIALGRAISIVSPLAEGADRLIVQRALARPGARLAVARLPLPMDDYLADFTSVASKEEFRRLVSQADEVIAPASAQGRDAAYHAAGLAVLDRSEVLIAVWDGQRGNTGTMVDEARRRRMPIAWVHAGNRRPGTDEPTSLGPQQGAVTFENF